MKTMNELAERAYALYPGDAPGHDKRDTYFPRDAGIGAYVKHSYEALRAIEEIAVRRGIGVSTALREGVITIQIQEQDLRIWIKIE